jgi:hypothetical protein
VSREEDSYGHGRRELRMKLIKKRRGEDSAMRRIKIYENLKWNKERQKL